MKEYSFLEETSVNGVLATAGMATIGSKLGEESGKQLGSVVSDTKHALLKANQISWTDPLFASIVKRDLLDAKENIKLAKEWLDSCDIEDKERAMRDYQKAIDEYKSIQRDIGRRNASRWLSKYKQALAVSTSEKYARRGKIIGGVGLGVATAARLGIPLIVKKKG